MKIRNMLKKAVAIGASSAMLGATIMGALALDLSDYPEPLVKDGEFNGRIVVGAKAQPADVVAAIDVAAALQAKAVEEVAVEVTGDSVSVSGGETEDVFFGACVNAATYDEGDLDGLLDSTIKFNGETLDVEEKVIVTANQLCIHNADDRDEYEDEPMMITNTKQDAVYYSYEFEAEKVKATDVGTGSGNDTLEIKLFGKSVEITDIENNQMTVIASTEKHLGEGTTLEIDGHTIKLVGVGTSSVKVDVDGQLLVIGEGSEETFDDADDYKVELKDGSIFFVEGGDDNSATLKLGDEISQTVDTYDYLELFGEPDDREEAEWYWKAISVTGGYVEHIQIGYNQKRTTLDNDWDFNAMKEGESIKFPNDYVSIDFANVKNDENAKEVKIYFDDELNNTDTDVLVFALPTGEEFFEFGGLKTDRVFVEKLDAENHSLWYRDDNDELKFATLNSNFNLTLDTDVFEITPDMVTGNFSFAGPLGAAAVDTIYVELTTDADGLLYFGNLEGDGDGEIFYSDDDGTTFLGIAGYDTPFLTDYGIIIRGSGSDSGPEDAMNHDELYLVVPEERPEAQIVFSSSGTSVTTTSEAKSYQVNPIAVGMAVLDTEAPALGSTPMLVIGGPYVNTYAATLLDNPTAEEIEALFTDGKAMIKLFADKNAILVAGYKARDTQGAAYVLADYDGTYAGTLKGTEVEVIVPSLVSITVTEKETV